jgi:hypothetical protein
VATTWGYKNDSGDWQESDPFSDKTGDSAADFPLETYKKAAGVAYEFSKKKLEDTRAQQEALNTQQQQYRQQDEARDYQQAQQAYKY